MADSGGGSEWGTFEIVLGVLLVLGLLARLQGTSTVSPQQQAAAPEQTYPITDPRNPFCGLTLYTPQSLEKVSTTVTLSGQLTGCNWFSSNGVALYAQVIDSKGKPVSEYATIPTSTTTPDGAAVFSTTIALTATPTTQKGILILVPTTPQGVDQPHSARVTIRFR